MWPITLLVSLRGVTFDNEDGSSRQQIIRTLNKGQQLMLRAEPNNKHDRWAVAVYTDTGEKIGYLPSDARDASTVLMGEPISTIVHRLTGAASWFNRVVLRKKATGVVIRIVKDELDWQRNAKLTDIAKPLDVKVEKSLALEKNGKIDKAIESYHAIIAEIIELNLQDKYASAHRHIPAPVDRLSLLLEKRKEYNEAMKVLEDFEKLYDPVQPTKAERERIQKRKIRIKKLLTSQPS